MQHQLDFKHICFQYPNSQASLFKELNFSVKTGELVGILGSSGSGKTTLTEILLGRHRPTCRHFQMLEDCSPLSTAVKWSYVPQQNLLREYLRVSEIFNIYADIHLKTAKANEKQQRIFQTLQDLGLSDFKDKKISELSGGQKRRVSIGIEMLSDSRYFILDEPSSGLDALSDRNLLRTLKIMARVNQKAIVVITHNTENLAILDKLIFLSKGKPTFVGSFEELLMEFKTTDRFTVKKYLDLSIADLYQELNASGRIYDI